MQTTPTATAPVASNGAASPSTAATPPAGPVHGTPAGGTGAGVGSGSGGPSTSADQGYPGNGQGGGVPAAGPGSAAAAQPPGFAAALANLPGPTPTAGTGPSFASVLAGLASGNGGPLPTVQAGPQMADQMVSVLSTLTSGPNGTHSVVLQMQPDGLGLVRAAVTTSPGAVAVHITAQTDAGYQALNRNLGELQTMLSGGGSFGATVLLSREQDDPGRPGTGRRNGSNDDLTVGAAESLEQVAGVGAAAPGALSDHTIDLHI